MELSYGAFHWNFLWNYSRNLSQETSHKRLTFGTRNHLGQHLISSTPFSGSSRQQHRQFVPPACRGRRHRGRRYRLRKRNHPGANVMILITSSLMKRQNMFVFLVHSLTIEISPWVGFGIVVNNRIGWQGLPGTNALAYLA
jgi:hypothetical protein